MFTARSMSSANKKLGIAVAGYNNNGKSTFNNALLRRGYCEANEDHCTRAIFELRLTLGDNEAKETNADEVLEETKAVNAANGNSDDDEMRCITINIVLPEELIQMHHGLSLSLYDLPGLDEYPQCYERWLKDPKGPNFDSLITIVDGSAAKGTAFQDQEKLLKDIGKLTDAKSTEFMPTFIVLNKIDDPTDADTKKRVAKYRKAIEKIFKVSCREKALEELLKNRTEKNIITELPPETFPIVVPVSSKNAFQLRKLKAYKDTKELMKHMEIEELTKLAGKAIGLPEAKKLSHSQLAQRTFDISRVEDSDKYLFRDALNETGFPTLMKAFDACFSGQERQSYLVCLQLQQELSKIKAKLDGGHTAMFLQNLLSQQDFESCINGKENFNQYKRIHEGYLLLVQAAFEKSPKDIEKNQSYLQHEISSFSEKVVPELSRHEIDPDFESVLQKWAKEQMYQALRKLHDILNRRYKEWKDSAEDQRWKGISANDWILNLNSVEDKVKGSKIDPIPIQQALCELRENISSTQSDPTARKGNSLGWHSVPEGLDSFLRDMESRQQRKDIHETIKAVVKEDNNNSHKLILNELNTVKRKLDQLIEREQPPAKKASEDMKAKEAKKVIEIDDIMEQEQKSDNIGDDNEICEVEKADNTEKTEEMETSETPQN